MASINPHDFWLSFGTSLESGSKTAQVPDINPGEYKSPHPKKIIVCCDGTWQNSTTGMRNIPSNVTRLSRSISKFDDNGIPQVVYYSAGVGTGDGVTFNERVRQAIFGDGLVSEVLKAYNFIVTNYTLGDEVMCFGFSRGAYTARSVAGLINDIGIVLPSEMHDFHELYEIYRKHEHNKSAIFRKSEGYRHWITGVKDKGHWTRLPHRLPPDCTRVVKVVGVFDTVGALGIPGHDWTQAVINRISKTYGTGIDNHSFHNHSLSRYIEHAFHALALDEGGYSFTPTLWRLPKTVENDRVVDYDRVAMDTRELQNSFRDAVKSSANDDTLLKHWRDMIRSDEDRTMNTPGRNDAMDLRQVWFPGSHINIGGGNLGIMRGVPFDYEQLSLISLAWMCDQVRDYLKLQDGPAAKRRSTLAEREMMARRRYMEVLRYEWEKKLLVGKAWDGLKRLVISQANPFGPATEDVAGAGWSTGPIIDGVEKLFNLVPFFLPTRWLTRTPLQYNKKDHAGNTGRGGDTCEEIHPSASYRWITDRKYRPKSLDGFKRIPVENGGVVHYVWRKEVKKEIRNHREFLGFRTPFYRARTETTILELRETPIRRADDVTR
ncbi:peptidoglycan-binding domain-containing protein, partial [Colletotrichum sojae]